MYTATSGKLARESDSTPVSVNLYAKLGLLDFIVASNGVKLFREGQADKVREIKRQRLQERTRRRA